MRDRGRGGPHTEPVQQRAATVQTQLQIHTHVAKHAHSRLQVPMLNLELAARRSEFTAQNLVGLSHIHKHKQCIFSSRAEKIDDDAEFSSGARSSSASRLDGAIEAVGDLRILSAARG